ncbi:hypothetical protein, partial [Paenibacillus sp.]|uniref:hypothetical protein n=1 Tax=Paenibacillus sp. TaxID=58172 RepID=UPI0028AF666E
ILFSTPNPRIPTLPHFSPLKHNRFAVKNQKPFSGVRKFSINQIDRFPKKRFSTEKSHTIGILSAAWLFKHKRLRRPYKDAKRLSEKYKT